MQYTTFGNTGMQVSRLSLGTMTFGHQLDAEASARILDEALDAGVNLIDTAESYANGASEEALGQALQGEKRERVFLATKVFRSVARDRRIGRNSRTNILASIEGSLRRLQTDYVDLFQLHHPDPDTPIDETLEAFDTVVRQGKARYVGVSNHYAWQMAWMLAESKARGLAPIVSAQVNYNVLDRQIETETLPFCRKFNLATMCYSPLCNGILSGKYLGLAPGEYPDGSRGMIYTIMKPYFDDALCREVTEYLASLAKGNGFAINQIALLWLLAKPDAATAIIGGSRPEHFRQILEIADLELPAEMVEKIDALSAPRIYSPFMNQPVRDGFALSAGR